MTSSAIQVIVGCREEVERFARAQRWREWGRASWQMEDGAVVHYVHFPEQLLGFDRGSTVHVVGELRHELRIAARGRSFNLVYHRERS